jgi:uncharacterized protein YbjQ (UPF0145 family)
MSNQCSCGFGADAPKEASESADLSPICIECLAAKRPDLLPGVVVRAAWLPSMTQEEISSGVRVLAYFAAFPAKVQRMLGDKIVEESGKAADIVVDDVDVFEKGETSGNELTEFEFVDGGVLTGKEVEDRIKKIAIARMSDVFLSSIEDAKKMFGSADVAVVKEMLEANPQLKADADLGLRFVPLTFDQDRMASWPMDKIIEAAKSYMGNRA